MPQNSFIDDLIVVCHKHGQPDFIDFLKSVFFLYYGIAVESP